MARLLLVNAALNMGSTGVIAEQIGILAKSKGWEAYMVHGARYKAASQLNAIQSVSLLQEEIHGLESFLLDRHGLSSRFSTKALIRKIREISPDIIHLHNIHGYYLNYQLLFEYLSEANIPVVWTLHDCWSMTGHCVYFSLVGCEKWKTGCRDCVQTRTYPRSLFFDRSSKNYFQKRLSFSSVRNMMIVPVSYWLGSLVRDSFLKEYPIHVIHNGIDLSLFKPVIGDFRQRYGIHGKKMILGVAFGWGTRKGLDVFVELSKRLSPEAYQIVLVGTNEAVDKVLPKQVLSIHRTCNQKELVEIYTAADVFVNPTREDNYPTVNMESLACGTPVVTFKTGGSPEAISADTGIVVEKDDLNSLLSAILELTREPKERYEVLCRERAIEFFDKNKQYEKYIQLYERLLNKKGVTDI